MGWTQLENNHVLEPPYPRRLLRELLLRNNISLGARILDAGCGRGELVRYLASLGFDPTGLDESEAEVELARELNPDLEFIVGGAPREQFELRTPGYDLIFARCLSAWSDSVFSRQAFLTTASLLSCLQPRGVLIFLCSTHSQAEPEHDVLCFARHLAQFPGECRIDRFHSGSEPAEFRAATLQLDRQPRSTLEWDRLGQKASSVLDGPCCLHAHPTVSDVRRAA